MNTSMQIIDIDFEHINTCAYRHTHIRIHIHTLVAIIDDVIAPL